MKRLLLVIIMASFSATGAHAQSSYLDAGENGVEIKGDLLLNDAFLGLSSNVGYSFSGKLDLGLAVNRQGYDMMIEGDNVSVTGIAPYASYLLIKQNETMPLSFGIDASYQYQKIFNDFFKENDVTMSGNGINIGANLFTDLKSEFATIQPRIGFSYETIKYKANIEGGSIVSDGNEKILDLGISFIFDRPSDYAFVFMPNVRVQDNLTSVGLSLGVILPHN